MSLARKEILKATLIGLLVACAILGVFVLISITTRGTFTVDTKDFDSELEWGENVSLDGIEIIDNRTLGFIKTPLSRDSVISVDDTDTSGQKRVVFEHQGQEFVVYFNVKYRVDFLSYGEVIDSQLVIGADELVPPVPTPATKASILPSQSAQISGPVVV